MSSIINAIRVEDFAQWKQSFDSPEGDTMRKAFGMKSYQIFQATDDSNYIVMKKATKRSGVVEKTDTYDTSKFLVEVIKKIY